MDIEVEVVGVEVDLATEEDQVVILAEEQSSDKIQLFVILPLTQLIINK